MFGKNDVKWMEVAQNRNRGRGLCSRCWIYGLFYQKVNCFSNSECYNLFRRLDSQAHCLWKAL